MWIYHVLINSFDKCIAIIIYEVLVADNVKSTATVSKLNKGYRIPTYHLHM